MLEVIEKITTGQDGSQTTTAAKPWKRISDEQLRHTWECPECERLAIVRPEFYQVNGTPVCDDCSEDMIYCWTEIR